MWDHLFSTTNDAGTKARYPTAGGVTDTTRVNAVWGVCAGMSVIWLKKMFATRDVLAAPGTGEGAIVHAKWANRFRSGSIDLARFNTGLAENAGLTVAAVQRHGARTSVRRMRDVFGSYYISTGNHAMAAVTGHAGLYFFDPNGGAWKTRDTADFDGLQGYIEQQYRGARYDPIWLLLRVTDAA